jgi:aminotransferase in exopolysaccharide biosynthesis
MGNFDREIQIIKELYGEDKFIPLHEPRFVGNEKAYLNECIDSTFVSSVGKYVDEFEDMMADYTGAKHAVAVVNGTAALHLSLELAGVEEGDLVVTQALSFVATANAISYLNASPYFIDVEMNTLGMSPAALKMFLEDVEIKNGSAIYLPTGKKVGAVVPMHTFGFPVLIEEIIELCDEYGIPVVEDAAESIGSKYKNQHTGTFGLFGAFSFNGNKTITCGGGGIIVTNDTELAKRAKHISTQAKIPHRWEYRHDQRGYNYRCPNINAALACAQLEKLEEFVENKRNTALVYKNAFDESSLNFIAEPVNSRSNYWLNALMTKNLDERNNFLEESNNNEVMTRPIWTLLNKNAYLGDSLHDGLENSRLIEERLVNIPSSVRL